MSQKDVLAAIAAIAAQGTAQSAAMKEQFENLQKIVSELLEAHVQMSAELASVLAKKGPAKVAAKAVDVVSSDSSDVSARKTKAPTVQAQFKEFAANESHQGSELVRAFIESRPDCEALKQANIVKGVLDWKKLANAVWSAYLTKDKLAAATPECKTFHKTFIDYCTELNKPEATEQLNS